MSVFTCFLEGKLTASPTTGHTRDGREYVQFPVVVRDRYRDHTGKWADGKAMWFEIFCWGEIATRVRDLGRGDQVVVEAGQLLPYLNDDDLPALKVQARNVSVSMRFTTAHAGSKVPQRRGDMVATPYGEKYPAATYPDVVSDPELVQHR